MSGVGGLDLRFPIGGLFTVLGLVLGGYGIATAGNAGMYQQSTGLNLNLIWGAVMLVFGVLFLLGAMRAARTHHPAGVHPTAESPEGRATEAREHDLGLER